MRALDVQAIRRALYDFIRFDPRDFVVRASPTGFLVSSANRQSRGGTPNAFFTAKTADGIRIYAGTVNNVLPAGMSFGDNPPYVLDITSGDGVVYLVLTVDAETEEINSLSIDYGSTLPDDDPVTLTYYKILVSYSTTDGAFFLSPPNLSGSQNFELCGGVEPIWRVI